MTQTRKKQEFAGRLVALIIFGVLVVASITLYFGASRFIQERTATKFEYDTQLTTKHMSEQIAQYADLLYNGRSLLELKPDISNSEWQKYFQDQSALSWSKGVSSVIYLTYASDVSSAQFTDMLNAQSDISPTLKLQPAGERDQYAATSLVASSHQLTYLLGGDMLSEPMRREALNASVQTQMPQATPPLKLKSGVDGFLLALPYQDSNDKLLGFTVLSFRSNDLVEALLDSGNSSLNVNVVDVTNKNEPKQLYKSPKWSGDGFTRSDELTVGGRLWQVTYGAPIVKYQDEIMRAVPIVLMMFGLISSFMVFIMILIIFQVPVSIFGHPLR